jgi:hypothetical protein
MVSTDSHAYQDSVGVTHWASTKTIPRDRGSDRTKRMLPIAPSSICLTGDALERAFEPCFGRDAAKQPAHQLTLFYTYTQTPNLSHWEQLSSL